MIWFHLILTVQLMSVLPSTVLAAYFRSMGDTAVERPKNDSTPYTSKPSTSTLYTSRHSTPTLYISRHSTPTLYTSRHSTPTLYTSRHSTPTLYTSRHSTPTLYTSRHSTPTRYTSKHSTPTRYISKHSTPLRYTYKRCGFTTTTPSVTDENYTLPPGNITELPPEPAGEIIVDGTSLVVNRKHGKTLPICSGIHLKPWIVLVAASCVYGQEMQGLKVVVKYYGRSFKPHSKTVDVFGIIFHPLYKPGSKDKNLAVLIVHSQRHWQVREFDLPELHLTTEYINSIHLKVHLIVWLANDTQTYNSKSIRAHVRKNYGVCGSLAVMKSWYCLETCHPVTFTKIDIASPMYFYDDKSHRNKVLLGFYLGNIIDPNAQGHLYLSAWSSIRWLRHMRYIHPLPPA